jgi:two-component system chemotaxis response regulator CheY
MKTLIVEDDFISRLILQELLRYYGPVHIAVNGKEAVGAVTDALEASEPYDLICMDLMMPEMDGQEALEKIRQIETNARIAQVDRSKIVMTTALADEANVIKAVQHQCDYFLVKPIEKAKLLEELRELKLIR